MMNKHVGETLAGKHTSSVRLVKFKAKRPYGIHALV
jgi:hypothetical protein